MTPEYRHVRRLAKVLTLSGILLLASAAALRAAPWTLVTPPNPCQGSTVYDPGHERMLLFDETDSGVWALPLTMPTGWQRFPVSGPSPGPRSSPTVVYDSEGDRLILHGGWRSNYLSDTWAFTTSGGLGVWTQLATAGPAPARAGAIGMYDTEGQRLVIYAGSHGSGVTQDEVWALPLHGAGTPTWTQILAAGPPPPSRSGPAHASDGTSLYIHGGGGDAHTDTWKLTLGASPAWTQLFPTGTPPNEAYILSMVYDPATNSLLLFDRTSARLSLNGNPTWSPLVFSGIGYGPSSLDPILSPASHSVWSAADITISPCNAAGVCFAHTTRLDLNAMHVEAATPDPRTDHSAVYDSRRDRMLLFSSTGVDSPGVYWAYSTVTGQWSKLHAAAAPSDLRHCLMDPTGDRVLVMSRASLCALPFSGPNAGNWTCTATTGAGATTCPPNANVALDVTGRKGYAFSGASGNSETWALSLDDPPTWTHVAAVDSIPRARWNASTIFDSKRHRLIVFGGRFTSGGGWYTSSEVNDAWQLDVNTGRWKRMGGIGSLPQARELAPAVYDSIGDRMVMFGGFNSLGQFGTYWSDVWALSLAGTGWWLNVVPAWGGPTVGYGATMALDTSRRLGLLFGGMDQYCVAYEDLWSLDLAQLQAVADVEPASLLVAALELPSPNPCLRETRVAFVLARGGRARVAVFDVAGRLVRVLIDGLAAPGRTVLSWDGRDTAGRPVASGVYLVRLECGEGSFSRRLMRIR
jgi:hypothetical protein